MKAWQIFAVGIAVLVASMFLQAYEGLLAGLGAFAVLSIVVVGFLARPRKDTFYIRTTVYDVDLDGEFTVEHDYLAVRVELARLWLLFLPTFGAIAFLLSTFANGTTWNFHLVDYIFNPGYAGVVIWRGLSLVVVGVLSAWINERWVLRDADACSAGSASLEEGYVSYAFVDHSGEYYGGNGFDLVSVPRELSTIVLYNVSKPQLNKIAVGCLFHRLVIIGHGLTDLDAATVDSRVRPVEATSS